MESRTMQQVRTRASAISHSVTNENFGAALRPARYLVPEEKLPCRRETKQSARVANRLYLNFSERSARYFRKTVLCSFIRDLKYRSTRASCLEHISCIPPWAKQLPAMKVLAGAGRRSWSLFWIGTW